MTPDDGATYEVLAVGGERNSGHSSGDGSLDSPDDSAGRAGRRVPRGRALGFGSLVLALVAGGAVYAAARSSDGGEQPESVLPRTAFAFAKVDLGTGGDHADALGEFAKRFPTAGAQNAEELRDRAVTALTKSLHIDYQSAVKPWLGRRAALAGFPIANGKPKWVVALQTSDPAAAKAALAGLPKPPAVTQVGAYVVLAENRQTLDAALDAAGDEPLAKDPEFASDLARLAGPQVGVSWIDNAKAVDAMLYESEHPTSPEDEEIGAAYSKTMRAGAQGRTVLGMHATANYAEIVGYTIGRVDAVAAGAPGILRTLPTTTIAGAYVAAGDSLLGGSGGGPFSAFGLAGRLPAMSFGLSSLLFLGGGGHSVDTAGAYAGGTCTAPPAGSGGITSCESWSSASTRPPEPALEPAPSAPPSSQPDATALAPTPARTGESDAIDEKPTDGSTGEFSPYQDPTEVLAKQFAGALSGDATIALGSLPLPGSRVAPDVALIGSTKDPARAQTLAAKVKKTFGAQFTNDIFSQLQDGVLTIASDARYAASLRGGGLGKTPLFAMAMGELGDQVELAVFVNLEGVRDVVPNYPKELLPVSAIGVSSSRAADVSVLRVRLVSR